MVCSTVGEAGRQTAGLNFLAIVHENHCCLKSLLQPV